MTMPRVRREHPLDLRAFFVCPGRARRRWMAPGYEFEGQDAVLSLVS
jgi:hypothetical protein